MDLGARGTLFNSVYPPTPETQILSRASFTPATRVCHLLTSWDADDLVSPPPHSTIIPLNSGSWAHPASCGPFRPLLPAWPGSWSLPVFSPLLNVYPKSPQLLILQLYSWKHPGGRTHVPHAARSEANPDTPAC